MFQTKVVKILGKWPMWCTYSFLCVYFYF